MNGPSEHLSWAELACKDGTPYPKEWREDRAVQLAKTFEFIRAACDDKPIVILSAFRTPTYNAKVGGVSNSQHIQGRALDLKPPAHLSINRFYAIIRKIAKGAKIRGIGKYLTFVHVDNRPGEHLALWYGQGVDPSGR